MLNTNNTKGKNILFIGASGHFELAIKKAKELGMNTYCVNYNKNAVAKEYADFPADVDTYVPDDVVEYARENHIDGIFTSWNEVNLYTSAYVAKKLNIPFYANKEQLDALITKDAFKKTCEKYGIPVVPLYFEGAELSESDIKKFEYPVIFKPVDSGGTRGMTILYDENNVDDAVEKAVKYSGSGRFLVEKYLKDVTLIVADYVIQDGKTYLSSVAQRVILRDSEKEVPLSIAFVYPSDYTELVIRKFNAPIQKLIDGLNIRDGIISFEGMVSGEDVYAIECQFRFGGTHFYTLLDEAYNIDLLGMMLEYAITGKFDQYSFETVSPLFKKRYACQNVQASKGVVENIEGFDEMLKIPGVCWGIRLKARGDRVPDDGSTALNFAKVGIEADEDKDLFRAMNAVQHTLKVWDEQGNDLIKHNIPGEYIK